MLSTDVLNKTFVTVAESGQIGRAAEAMGRSCKTLHYRVRRLEKSLGFTLFAARGGHTQRAILTQEGYRYLQRITKR